MFSFRRSRPGGPSANRPADVGSAPDRQPLFYVDFDMMLKGSIYQRRKGPVRQFGVTVNGATRLVTSGDTVDLDTYNALLAAGAIRPVAPNSASAKTSGVVDYLALEDSDES